MKKAAIALMVCLALLGGTGAGALDRVGVSLDGAVLDTGRCPVYNSTTYVPLRTVVEALRPDASVRWEEGRAVARGAGLTLTARPGDCYIEANGRALYVRDGVRLERGSTLVPVRVLCTALGAQVDWNPSTGGVSISRQGMPLVPGSQYYKEEDLLWLSRIISAESRGEPFQGQIAVGNVVLNRVASPEFPDSIQSVIFDSRWGGQFEPVRNGTIYQTPEPSCIVAAKLCLEGAGMAGGSLYFLAPALTANHWIMENRPYVTTIGSHWFYA